MRSVVVVLAAGLLLPAALLALAAPPAPSGGPPPLRVLDGDTQDLVLFQDARPYLIRLHLQVRGQAYQTGWQETVKHLFRYLDVNGDGVLSPKEAALAPSSSQWVQLMNGGTLEPDAAPEFAELAGPGQAKVTLEQFAAYYRHTGGGALQVEWGWRLAAEDRLTDALFRQLDRDKDGALSRQELTDARASLNQLDLDGDELIVMRELAPNFANPSFTFRSTTDERPAPPNFPFMVLHADTPADRLTAQLLNRYDRNKDRKLSRTEVQLEPAVFDRLDANRDGRLDGGELARWRQSLPDLELILPLDTARRQDVLVLPGPDGKPHRLASFLSPGRDGALRIPLAEKQLEVVRADAGATLRQSMLKDFDRMAGKDGVLRSQAIYQPPFTFVALSRLADRDGDNNLSRKELAEFLEIQEKFFARSTFLALVDRGRSLFEFLDSNHDGRLGQRELRSAWPRLAPWAQGGKLTRQQVPQQFQLVLSHGRPRSQMATPGDLGFGPPVASRNQAHGPLWFRKMDRNGDGDVSPAEFLGTPEQFRRLDADGDGLIDISEAERADQEFRNQKR